MTLDALRAMIHRPDDAAAAEYERMWDGLEGFCKELRRVGVRATLYIRGQFMSDDHNEPGMLFVAAVADPIESLTREQRDQLVSLDNDRGKWVKDRRCDFSFFFDGRPYYRLDTAVSDWLEVHCLFSHDTPVDAFKVEL